MARSYRHVALGRLRLATVEDVQLVKELLNESMALNFRISSVADIVYLIENGVLSICQLDVNEKLVGFLSLRDYPLIPSVHPSAWEEYIWAKYKATELNSRNTLFIHLLCWDKTYSRELVDNMLRSVFMHDAYVHHIAFVKSLPNLPMLLPGQSRAEGAFRKVTATERGIPGDLMPTLSIVDRGEVCPGLKIRRAVEEDNDDIVPIVGKHSERLQELYGEFYISELISRHPESERALLVCEHKDIAVGVMCLNTQINFEALEENFELSPFAGLRRMNVSPFHGQGSDLEASMSYTASATFDYSQIDPIAARKAGRVTWLFDKEDFKAFAQREVSPLDGHMPTPAAQLDILNILESDEEDFEFDIVNIDTSLLRVPKFLAYDEAILGPTDSAMKMLDPKRHTASSATAHKEQVQTHLKGMRSGEKPSGAGLARETEPVRYKGPPNAFIIELFAIHEDHDERYAFDMLEAAFEFYPNRDYCILCLPSNHASFPLLEHFTLVTPYSVCPKYINETLYVAHVNSVRGYVRVREGEAYDIETLCDILEHESYLSSLLELYESTLTSQALQSYVMLSQQQPVGVVILGPLEDGLTIRTQYDLEPEPRRNGTDGFILYGILSPVLEPHSRWFLRELLRLSQYTTLFWLTKLYGKADVQPGRRLMSFAGHMVPVHPRAAMPNITGNDYLDKIQSNFSIPFALWFIERPLTSLPKVNVNNSIVVVGASRTGLAFIETLLLGPTSQYLTFTNITLVSAYGLPSVSECLEAAITCVPKDGRYTDRYMKSVPFYFYIDVMSALMVGIDRKLKCIHLKGGGVKYYDQLVLTCGQQFQHPDYLREPLELVKEVERGKLCERMLMDNYLYRPDNVPIPPELPENVYIINSLYEANICLRKLMRMVSDTKDTQYCLSAKNQILVYGECIEAYSCMAALLELGLSPEMICFIEPFPPEEPNMLRVNCFNNEQVDERAQKSIEDLGIKVYRKCQLASWMQRGNNVESLHLMSRLQTICLPCFALFYYGLKSINIFAFKAINECGLVYDGGLVVGPSFETNDPSVYGAGTCIKYSRRLYANNRAHKYYCSEDVGEALGLMYLKLFDPFIMGDPDVHYTDLLPRYSSVQIGGLGKSTLGTNKSSLSSNPTATTSSAVIVPGRRWQPVLNFVSPIVTSATLPGPLYYLKVRRPGMEIPMELQLILPNQGHTLLTDKDGRYFRLQLDNLHTISGVTCLSNHRFSPEILSQLYSHHEAYFNNLLTRFMKGLIEDLFEYFTQPWMSAMYQETFRELLTDIYEEDVATIYDLVRNKYDFQEDVNLSRPSRLATRRSMTRISNVMSKELTSGSLKSVLEKYASRISTVQMKKNKAGDIPSECGQSACIRQHTRSFWKTAECGRIVIGHLARYLVNNNVTNRHYAVPDPEFFQRLLPAAKDLSSSS